MFRLFFHSKIKYGVTLWSSSINYGVQFMVYFEVNEKWDQTQTKNGCK